MERMCKQTPMKDDAEGEYTQHVVVRAGYDTFHGTSIGNV